MALKGRYAYLHNLQTDALADEISSEEKGTNSGDDEDDSWDVETIAASEINVSSTAS